MLTQVANLNDPWWADGFPGEEKGKVHRLTGKITADRDKSLELLIEQGTTVTWRGISGTAIYIKGGVAGVITEEMPGTNTLEAASYRVIARLISALDAVKRETGLLKRLGTDWNGDVQDLLKKLADLIEIPKLFESLRECSGESLTIRVVAGIGPGPNEEARRARLKYAYGIAIGGGSLYVSSSQGFGIYRIRDEGEPEVLAKAEGFGGAHQLVCDEVAENLFVARAHAHIIQKVSLSNGETETIAGRRGTHGFAGDGGRALEASLSWPRGVAITPQAQYLYIADTQNHRIRRVSFWDNNTVQTIAGNGTKGYSGDRGPALLAQLNEPTFLELDWTTGYLFFSDRANHCIRRIRLEDNEITTVVGTGQAGFSEDGSAGLNASIDDPRGLAMTSHGLCFAEAGNRRVRLLREDGTLTTIAGNGRSGFGGDYRNARLAELVGPVGLCAGVSPIDRAALGIDTRGLVLYVVDGDQIKALGNY